jgi:hypothetical protein
VLSCVFGREKSQFGRKTGDLKLNFSAAKNKMVAVKKSSSEN